MKKLDINRDKVQPSDEDLLLHQNFEDVLKKANLKEGANAGIKTSKSWWFLAGGLLLVLGIIFAVLNVSTNITNSDESLYVSGGQDDYKIEKENIRKEKLLSYIMVFNDDSVSTVEKIEMPRLDILKEDILIEEPIDYYYPKEASTLTFTLEESFGLKSQYKKMPEFAIYDNLVFQPIGEYQKGWLKANWSEVELIKKGESYFLLLKKNGTTFVCEVVPVFEYEDFVTELDVYANAKNM